MNVTSPWRRAWIGLGANLPSTVGDSIETLARARKRIAALPESRALHASSLYRSAPFEASGPDFHNQVVRIETRLAPEALLTQLLAIEQSFGRERPFRNAPRTLDLDLLMVEGEARQGDFLTLPHPRLHERLFVLMPLAELDPTLIIPSQGASVSALLHRVQAADPDQHCERLG